MQPEFIGFTLGDALQQGFLLELSNYAPPGDAKFQAGVVAITQGVANLRIEPEQLHQLLHRHLLGDFGSFGQFDSIELTEQELTLGSIATDNEGKLNKLAILGKNHDVLSEYDYHSATIWIKTEAVNSSEAYTTLMLPSEY
jgi:hypothetical protein